MAKTDSPGLAERVLGIAAHRVRDSRLKADVLAEAAESRFALGYTPRHLRQAYAAELACADGHLKAGRQNEAAASVAKALLLAFHRGPHLDSLSSPLATDPRAFTAPLRGSAAMRVLRAGPGREEAVAAPPADRPLRLLVAYSANKNFLAEVIARYEHHPGVELRVLDTAADPGLAPLAKGMGRMTGRRLGGQQAYGRQAEAALRPHLDWADVVFIDWCAAAAAFFTLVDPGTTRIVVRLHSYEALTHWPHLVDFSRVDDLVFVSEHLRDLSVSAVPGLGEKSAPRLHVIDNAVLTRRFVRPKTPDARFTLGLMGTSQIAKDPRWALEVLRLVRREDARYRLQLVGGPFNSAAPGVERYRRAYEAELAPLRESGAARQLGRSEDVPAAFTEIGVVLSSSVRESWSLSTVEGAASAAVPVVRDWPFFAGTPHGARTLFPESWVVTTPAEAAARVREVTATEESWLAAGRAASAHALATWDWERTGAHFDRLLLDRAPDICSPGHITIGKAAE
ncbi:glycosyltransferase family protein [Streptomyces corynorhini]|uniref:Glycosyltransferase family 1 protein n=1 Tax=Streptomyces corynorhini TaxID=2282652 RepID=A0A370BDC2_9ACTN|nr:hypothetical protein [Streptomyces corynorhini]RDG39750.1 hypothetical protein DVH02_02315 [Streptomyces corynorhini]